MNPKEIKENVKEERLQNNTERLIKVYLRNSEYHSRQFRKYITGETQFNFAAFFFNPVWLLFKGMIFYGMSIILCISIVSFIPHGSIIILLPLTIFIGLKGNSIYYKHVEKKVDRVMGKYTEHEKRIKIIDKSRNISVICGVIIYGIIIYLDKVSFF